MAIPTELVQQTRDRYEQRAAQREETSERLKTGTPLEVDTPGRVQRRVSRLAATEAARERPASASVMALERILGRSDLMSVNYLEIGLQAARCVGRISIRTRTGQVRGYGTGFTVSPRLLITNNHVLDSAGQAATSRVEFNFQEDPAGNPVQAVVLNLEPERFFITDEALDFTVVALADRAADGSELGRFCWLPLIEEQGKVLVGEYLNIIQHPEWRTEAARPAREPAGRSPARLPPLPDRHRAGLVGVAGVQRPVGGRRVAPFRGSEEGCGRQCADPRRDGVARGDGRAAHRLDRQRGRSREPDRSTHQGREAGRGAGRVAARDARSAAFSHRTAPRRPRAGAGRRVFAAARSTPTGTAIRTTAVLREAAALEAPETRPG